MGTQEHQILDAIFVRGIKKDVINAAVEEQLRDTASNFINAVQAFKGDERRERSLHRQEAREDNRRQQRQSTTQFAEQYGNLVMRLTPQQHTMAIASEQQRVAQRTKANNGSFLETQIILEEE